MAYGIPGYGYGSAKQVPSRDILGPNAMSGSTTSNRFNPYWRKENSFEDQMLHNQLIAEASDIKGAAAMYYITSLEQDSPIFQEDRMRNVERTFEIRVCGDGVIQGDNYQYSKFMIMGMDEFSVFIHRTQFFEHNMINLLENGIQPASAGVHNIWGAQRGYSATFYKGFAASQIYPKAGDLLKLNFEESLYEVTDISDKVAEDQFSQAKYWFKVYLKPFRDDGRDVSQTISADPKDSGYIESKFNNHMDALLGVGDGVKEKKDEVLYRPPSVPDEVNGITDQPSAQGPDVFGGW